MTIEPAVGPASPLAGVRIVVLTWNAWRLAEQSLDSLRPARKRGARVIVVDNGSEDETVRRVGEEFPDDLLIANGANLGFAAGCNVGLRAALADGAEFVALLNQDAIVAPDWCDELVAAAIRFPDAGTVSSMIFLHEDPVRIWYAGATFSTLTGRSRHRGYGEIDRGQFDEEFWTMRPSGCAMLMRRRLVERLGGFDEALFLYGEELDLSLRTKGRGYYHLVAPRSRCWHRVSASSGGARTGRYLYYHTRNMLYLIARHAPVRSRWRGKLREWLVLATMVASIGTMRLAPVRALRAIADGWSDYRRKRMGPRSEGRGRSAR